MQATCSRKVVDAGERDRVSPRALTLSPFAPRTGVLSRSERRLSLTARPKRMMRWGLAVCGLGLLLNLFSVAAVAQERGRDVLAAEELFRRGAWTQAEDKLTLVLESTTQGARTDEKVRTRRRCLFLLAETCRRLGRHSEALEYALQYRQDLKAERNADIAEFLQQNEIGMAESQMALSNFSEARATLEELLSNRLAKLKDFRKLQVLVTLATVEHLANRA